MQDKPIQIVSMHKFIVTKLKLHYQWSCPIGNSHPIATPSPSSKLNQNDSKRITNRDLQLLFDSGWDCHCT